MISTIMAEAITTIPNAKEQHKLQGIVLTTESCLTLPDGFSVGFSGWARDYSLITMKDEIRIATAKVRYIV